MTWQEALAQGIGHLERADPVLRPIILSHPQPDFHPHSDYYHELVGSIISQQLSVKAAATIHKRFVALFGYLPEPTEILACDDSQLRGIGLSGQKTRYIKDLAEKIVSGEIQFDHLNKLSNDDIVAELTAVKGIGEWTVHMFLIFCIGRLDVLPIGDLGIKNAARMLYALSTLPSPEELRDIAKRNHWHPHESIASWYLWRSLDDTPLP